MYKKCLELQVIETIQTKRTKSRQVKVTNTVSGLIPTKIGVKIRKLLNFTLKFVPDFVKKVQKLK